MPFRSILFDESEVGTAGNRREAPEFFTDLNLDQIVASITAGRDEYDLKPFFYSPASQIETVRYRQEVFRDLEDQTLLAAVGTFAQQMRTMRGHLVQADKLHEPYQKQRWFLDAVDLYGEAIGGLACALARADLRSRGFLAFREYLTAYTQSSAVTSLVAETHQLTAALSRIRYGLHIEGNRVTVSRDGSESDYGAEVLRTFEKFKQGATKEYRFDFPSGPDMNHVEAAVLERVARLHPDIFSSLGRYCAHRRDYLDDAIRDFDREVQFYVAYLDHIARVHAGGLNFCYPAVSDRSKAVCGLEVFDLALADRLVREQTPVVTNDFSLEGPERILVVTGPNQGGKTTFARMVGQLHYLASLGCPVPGRAARLFFFDRLFTHFEREEHLENLSGKLEDDLRRIHRILEVATGNSILIMNESFLSTTLSDALFLSQRIMHRIIERGLLCVSVTFLDELASLGDATVSMVGTVDPVDPALRTFKIVRRPADGLAYAAAIARQYDLTYERIKERLAS